MKCPACGGDYLAGDRFCGTCGERLPQEGESAAASPPAASIAAPSMPAEPSGPACPVCGAGLASEATRCDVCGFEPGASVVIAGAQAAPRPMTPSPDASARVCPVHGPLDPSWTRCPYCLREGREGRLASGPIGSVSQASQAASVAEPAPPPPSVAPAAVAAPAPLQPVIPPQPAAPPAPPPRMEPQEAIVPAAPAPAPQAESAPVTSQFAAHAEAAPPPPAPVRPAAPANDLPRSSVGATFAIRRRPRVLAYLIEREGEAVGRVHQLEDDVTDIGRDPTNHIALSDVQISGFHARIERGPDGSFLLHDRNSTNGTFVNGDQVKDMRPIDENDALRLGSTTLVLKIVS